jgi:hypothetical protein
VKNALPRQLPRRLLGTKTRNKHGTFIIGIIGDAPAVSPILFLGVHAGLALGIAGGNAERRTLCRGWLPSRP